MSIAAGYVVVVKTDGKLLRQQKRYRLNKS
jgi:hypothetical protein